MKRKRKTVGLADVQEAMRPKNILPTPEQLAKGSYEDRFVMHVDTQTKAKTYVSAHSPVERWHRAGRLSDAQMGAIELVRGLWRQTELHQRLTSTYGQRMPIGFDNEWAAIHEIEARKRLKRIEDYIPAHWWECFENVVRWDEAAGVAGSALGYGSANAEIRAHMIVVCVADLIVREERL